jgi:hypothetical protein
MGADAYNIGADEHESHFVFRILFNKNTPLGGGFPLGGTYVSAAPLPLRVIRLARTSAGTPRNAPRHFNRVARSAGTPFPTTFPMS